MYQLFYALTALFLIAWIVCLNINITDSLWVHTLLAVAVLCMGIGLYLRSAKNT